MGVALSVEEGMEGRRVLAPMLARVREGDA